MKIESHNIMYLLKYNYFNNNKITMCEHVNSETNLFLLAETATSYAHPEVIKNTLTEFIHRMFVLIENSIDPKNTYLKITLSNMLYVLGAVSVNYLCVIPTTHVCREVLFNMTLWLDEMKKNVHCSPEHIFMFNEMIDYIAKLYNKYK